jgi:hypothetical protein
MRLTNLPLKFSAVRFCQGPIFFLSRSCPMGERRSGHQWFVLSSEFSQRRSALHRLRILPNRFSIPPLHPPLLARPPLRATFFGSVSPAPWLRRFVQTIGRKRLRTHCPRERGTAEWRSCRESSREQSSHPDGSHWTAERAPRERC